MVYQIGQFINGSIHLDSTLKKQDIYNPATGSVIGEVQFADESLLDQAVDCANAAFEKWSQTPPQSRVRMLFRFKTILEQKIEVLAKIVNKEHGKTLEDAHGSIMRGIELIEFCCSMPFMMRGSYSENVAHEVDCVTVRQALGVCAGISPFNFPVMVPIWMFVPAIAAGNTFILKPSEQDPKAVLFLAECLQEAGCPDGVVNILNGDKDIVDTLCHHPGIEAITAVASSQVAKSIQQKAVKSGKRSVTFGGAKNHVIVMPDADTVQAAESILGAAYGSAGERCMALSVAVTTCDDTANQLITHFQEKLPKIKIGPGDKKDIMMGPVISKQHLERVRGYINIGAEENAKLIIDGREQTFHDYPNGYFIGPTLFDHVTANMRIYQEEIFGPVLCVVRTNSFEEALELINKHPYGNGTAIFTRSGQIARSFASRVQAGMVGINVPIPVPIAYHSFGGWKQSMFGDIAMHGDQSILFYTKSKTITSRWPHDTPEAADFTMPHAKKEL